MEMESDAWSAAHPNPARFYDDKCADQILPFQGFECVLNFFNQVGQRCTIWNPQHYNAKMRRRISKDIGKSKIDSDDNLLMRLGIAIDFGIGMALQVSIVYMLGGIS
jgi:hypothetical protein